MADYSVKAANMGRIISIVHIIIGFLLFCFGIADLVVAYFYTGYIAYGIWIGIWMCITGGLGIPGTGKERSTSRNAFAGVFMGFSITSAVFGGIIIISYSVAIAIYSHDYNYRYGYRYRDRKYDAEMAISVIILVLGIVEFAIGIWAAICCCMMKPCTCCYSTPPQQGQVMYTTNTGYPVTQMPGGPVAVPMQTAGGMVTVQAVSQVPQQGQPQMIMVPVTGAQGTQPQFIQVASPGATATGYQPQHTDVSQSYGHGQYMALQDQQIPEKI